MSGSFSGLFISSSALRSFQRGIETAGHNLANVNTPGYSRQRVDYATLPPQTFYERGMMSVGRGVTLGSISRARDMFLDGSRRNVESDLNRATTLSQQMTRIEGVYNEPGDLGISSALGAFFDSWGALGSRPDDPAARVQVRQTGQALSDRIRTAYGDLSTINTETATEIDRVFNRIDQLAAQINTLNKEIKSAQAGSGTPNDLMDQRDLAVQELSGLIDVRVSQFQDGTYSVYSAGHFLVDGAGTRPIPRTYDAATGNLTAGSTSYPVRGGQLGGLLQSLGSIQTRQTELDAIANTLRQGINDLHFGGIGKDGSTGQNFFDATNGNSGAIDFRLSDAILASADAIAAGTTGKESDGGLAHQMAALRDASQGNLGNRSFTSYYENALNTMASESAYYRQQADVAGNIKTQVENQQLAVSGVSIDEEMAEMVKFQRSYQAAAKALTIFDQMTEDIINMVRR